MVNQAFRIKIAYRRNYGGYMRRLRRLYEKKEKIPGIGRYPMGPTNIDVVNIGSQHLQSTFVLDTDSRHWLREFEDEYGESGF